MFPESDLNRSGPTDSLPAAPAGQDAIDVAAHRLARLAPLHSAHEQLVMPRVPVTDGCDHRQDQGALFKLLRRRRPSDPAALPHRRMPSDGFRLFGRTARKEPPDLVRHRPRQLLVLASPTLGLAPLAPHPNLGVPQAFRLGLLQRAFLDQKTLPLVMPARSAEADNRRPEVAFRLGPARECGVAAAE